MNNSSDSEEEEETEEGCGAVMKLDDLINFRVDPEAAALVMQLRQKWHSLFLRRMRSPTKHWSQFDEVCTYTSECSSSFTTRPTRPWPRGGTFKGSDRKWQQILFNVFVSTNFNCITNINLA